MKEEDYVKAQNLANLRAAFNLLNDIMPIEGFLSEDEIAAVRRPLGELREELISKIEFEEV